MLHRLSTLSVQHVDHFFLCAKESRHSQSQHMMQPRSRNPLNTVCKQRLFVHCATDPPDVVVLVDPRVAKHDSQSLDLDHQQLLAVDRGFTSLEVISRLASLYILTLLPSNLYVA